MKKKLLVKFLHEYQEGNLATDYLACLGADDMNGTWYDYMELPQKLRGIIKLDNVGLLALRHK